MQASSTAAKAPASSPGTAAEPTAEVRETAVRLGALLRHLFLFDRGQHLHAIEESGLTLTQCKALLLLAAAEAGTAPAAVGDLADTLGVSLAAVSRAVDGLVRKRLVTRVEDERDRRVRRIAITGAGTRLAEELIATRMAGLEDFSASLTAAQRRKLDAALASLLEREEIASAFDQLRAVRRR